MNISYTCRQCKQPVRAAVAAGTQEVTCSACGAAVPLPAEDFSADEGRVRACLICGCRDLFVRKDFSQRLGVTIVVVGLILSTVAWGFHWRYVSYGILFATALCDVVLYFTVGNMLQCYRCQAAYRGLSGLEAFEPFDLETYERFRQQALRMAQARKS